MTDSSSPFAHLRPTSAPEMLDRLFALLVRFLPWFIATGLLSSILNIYEHFTGAMDLNQPVNAALLLASLLVSVYLQNFVTLILFQGYITPQRPLALRSLAWVALKRVPVVAILALLSVAITMMLIVLPVRTGEWLLPLMPRAGAIAAAVAVAIVLTFTALHYWLIMVVAVVENRNPWHCLTRSVELMRSFRCPEPRLIDRPLVRLLLLLLPVLVVAAVVAAAAYWHGVFRLQLPHLLDLENPAVYRWYNIWMTILLFFVAPMINAGAVLLYVESRMRREAMDFYLRIRHLRQTGDPFYYEKIR